MDFSQLFTIDFETDRIRPRPHYPPEPVGVSVRYPDGDSAYYAWGHPSGNNTSRDSAADLLRQIFADPQAYVLCHNAAFELAVCAERLGLQVPPWHRVHDTMFLLFLYDPHAPSMGLKPSAERILGWPAEEQDAVHEWIYEHRKELIAQYGTPDQKITRAKSGDNSPAAWIAYAPGDLVGRYANGDTARTYELFRKLYPKIRALGMEDAYDRERKLLPILMENERQGLFVDLERLQRDVPIYDQAMQDAEDLMRDYLGAATLSFNNDEEIAEIFESRGIVHEGMWKSTKTGKLSVSKDNLPPSSFVDPLFASVFGYRNRLETCLKMFLRPWLEQGTASGGRIFTQWNQVRSSRSGGTDGTRSGRPSMTKPNLLNVSKSFEGRSDGYVHPVGDDLPISLPNLPLVRRYILPDPGNVWLHRDFSGQEVRIFGHYESGDLAQAYRDKPDLDPHKWVGAQILERTGKELERTRIKNVTFARLYGGGPNAVFQQARCDSLKQAKEIMAYHDQALPGRRILNDEILRIAKRGDPIRTWGGRLYWVEPPAYSKEYKRMMTFEYKLINYLVQGSAADLTKEAINDWYYGGGSTFSRFLLTVYDEINICTSPGLVESEMEFLRECMEKNRLDVPMRSEGKTGVRWGDLEKYEEER